MNEHPAHPELPFIAYTGDAPYIFVSYAHSDATVVYAELKWLHDLGYNIWYDEGISPGHGWQGELAHSLEESSLFLLYVTDDSLKSPNCRREANFALEQNVPVLAIHLSDSELSSEWQFAIGDRQAILKPRFNQETYEQKLLSALHSFLPEQGHRSAVTADSSGPGKETPELSQPLAVDSDTDKPVHASDRSDDVVASGGSPLKSVFAGLVFILVLVGIGYYWFQQQQTETWLNQEMLPEIASLVNQDLNGAAYRLAKEVEARAGRDRVSEETWQAITTVVNIKFRPEGTRVSWRSYDQPDTDWHYIGETPLGDVELPKDMLVLKLEKDGFDPSIRVMQAPSAEIRDAEVEKDYQRRIANGMPSDTFDHFYLTRLGETPEGMVHVPDTDGPVFYSFPGVAFYQRYTIPAYYIDRFEVTNKAFKAFIDAGAYQQESYWQGLDFVREGESIGWQQAVESFVDTTGEPGPASWAFGTFPEGKGDYPVNGVSWYEANAYARFNKQRLPTAPHWARAAVSLIEIAQPLQPSLVRHSNFTEELAPVAEFKGLASSGASDMAGNVREWTSTGIGKRKLILGGAYNDPPYLFSQPIENSPWNRDLGNGFRCISPIEPIPEELAFDLAERPPSDPELYTPITDEIFESLLSAYQFPPFAPNAKEFDVQSGGSYWQYQKVSLAAGNGNERFDAYLYLPTNHSPPYQGIVHMPGSGSFSPQKFQIDANPLNGVFQKHLRRGRAVIWPIYYGTYNRYDNFDAVAPEQQLNARLERMRRWHKEIYSTLNYLESRGDFESNNFGYEGLSFGAIYPTPLLYLEPRFKAAALLSGSIIAYPLAAVSPFQFILRTTTPTLILNGEHDYLIPLTGAQSMYDNLATPEADKRFVTYNAGHWPLPRSQTTREINQWFDKYLGPVKR